MMCSISTAVVEMPHISSLARRRHLLSKTSIHLSYEGKPSNRNCFEACCHIIAQMEISASISNFPFYEKFPPIAGFAPLLNVTHNV